MNVTEATLRMHVAQGQTITVPELQAVANLLRYFAVSADEMERRLAGEIPIELPTGGNVVSLAAFATKLKAAPNLENPA